MIECYFKFVLMLVVSGLLGFILVGWFKLNSAAILLHISWYCSTWVLLIGIGFSIMIYILGIAVNNGICLANE